MFYVFSYLVYISYLHALFQPQLYSHSASLQACKPASAAEICF